ncbi:RNA ligase family protein [Tengunoibacter tsumagoiensis]|uniref:RNA ligase n=1 Tax=Tengunoibacter tsumagoiensis TaxID=2014871 RepID=A0A402A4W3_9CHLR|nr:RNA ligase family protein [Tengunoibacter tsumagoiensis]GCE14188.1 RNA ligase [Tengunoibacter tsumagoiensis]GCE14242.1 RNA ligase [Tengunoibacter tsumagoiensis]
MPSPLHVPVATISTITPHSNADSLDLAQVLGWQCVVPRGKYAAGDKVVYFAPDTVLPREVSDRFGVTAYLDHQRIKATRLRGEPSFGLVMPCENDEWQVGDNVAEHYGAAKYEPPLRGQGKHIDNPDAQPKDPLFPEYTAINNLRHHPNVFGDNEIVVVTEKIHGTNSRIGMVNGQWMAGSHRVRRGEGDELYWSPRRFWGVKALIENLSKYHQQIILYGEILGSDVQSLDYGYKGHEGYRAFDLLVDGRFLDYDAFFGICTEYGVKMVPRIAPFTYCTLDKARKWASGVTQVAPSGDCFGANIREGVVIKPLIERTDPRIGRAILKYVSDDFLLAKKSDFTEV